MADLIHTDDWEHLRQHTPARLALGRAGHSLPTRQLLAFNMDHARARDAVHSGLDMPKVKSELATFGLPVLHLRSQAADRREYLLRPDYGRQLHETSRKQLDEGQYPPTDLCIVVADGLSAHAVNHHAVEVIKALLPILKEKHWQLAPLCLVEQGRVAIADEIGEKLKARMILILLGERPGLSSPHSLGAYLTYGPRVGLTDESRNCVSNIRPDGLTYERAAEKIMYLLQEMKTLGLSGVGLKDDSAGYLSD
ncbi:MAG: ethanolamine ammonia-lyase subunit EutC [Bacteroidetes bacterium]|nr:ethanolamine ammonia-lyase subunit EutC [Bacteroidota bacterium]